MSNQHVQKDLDLGTLGCRVCKIGHGGLVKILLYTLFGVALNSVLWLLGPQNPKCDPGTGYGRPECQGLLFDFTICPDSGRIFPLVFQMWYTAMLMALMLLNWPLFAFLRNGTCHLAILGLQVIASVGLESAFVVLAGSEISNPALIIGIMVVCEVVFLGLAVLTMPQYRPSRIPLRFIHCCLGAVTTVQFGCVPYAPVIEHISGAFVVFILTGLSWICLEAFFCYIFPIHTHIYIYVCVCE